MGVLFLLGSYRFNCLKQCVTVQIYQIRIATSNEKKSVKIIRTNYYKLFATIAKEKAVNCCLVAYKVSKAPITSGAKLNNSFKNSDLYGSTRNDVYKQYLQLIRLVHHH